MKTILLAAMALVLAPLAACSGSAVNLAQDNAAESHEANADYYQKLAEDSSNAAVANAVAATAAMDENAADPIDNAN